MMCYLEISMESVQYTMCVSSISTCTDNLIAEFKSLNFALRVKQLDVLSRLNQNRFFVRLALLINESITPTSVVSFTGNST